MLWHGRICVCVGVSITLSMCVLSARICLLYFLRQQQWRWWRLRQRQCHSFQHLISCFLFYFAFVLFFLFSMLIVVVFLCLSCLHGSSERYSKSFHLILYSVPFHSIPLRSESNVCIVAFIFVFVFFGFYGHNWCKVIFLCAILYDLIFH